MPWRMTSRMTWPRKHVIRQPCPLIALDSLPPSPFLSSSCLVLNLSFGRKYPEFPDARAALAVALYGEVLYGAVREGAVRGCTGLYGEVLYGAVRGDARILRGTL